jgi:hypothetical protein
MAAFLFWGAREGKNLSWRCASGEGGLQSEKEGKRRSRLTDNLAGGLQHLRVGKLVRERHGGGGDLGGGGGGRGGCGPLIGVRAQQIRQGINGLKEGGD